MIDLLYILAGKFEGFVWMMLYPDERKVTHGQR